MAQSITVLVGTSKGVFLIDSDQSRKDWRLSGPYCDGWPSNHVLGDPATGTIWAAAGGVGGGAQVEEGVEGVEGVGGQVLVEEGHGEGQAQVVAVGQVRDRLP